MVAIPAFRPNVVLMDLRLPGESGIACTAQLREMLPDLQIIVLTVYKDIKTIFQALKAGASGYVLKRSADCEILEAISEVCSGGAPMTGEIARMVVRLFIERPKPSTGNKLNELSSREKEILLLLAEGSSNKEIASRLLISPSTVRSHLSSVYDKLHVRCRTEAVAKYFRSDRCGVRFA